VTDQPLEPDDRARQAPEPKPELETEPEPTQAAAPPPGPAPVEHGPKRLFRSRDDSVIAGVCGGLGRYLGVDAVLIRIAAVVLVFAGGAGILLYVIGWIAIPEEPEPGVAGETVGAEAEQTSGAVVLGLAFVVLGLFFLLDELWPDFLSWKYTWPIALIAVGIAIVVRGRR
jgi:phage shock protein C